MTTKEQQEIDILRAENARLRKALEDIFLDAGRAGGNMTGSPHRQTWEAARAALAAKGAE